ncbi:ral guanine nucleotide dissociation stimulator-like isoform X2 [Nycticebus coucang]|uniref:ral guanine nucleotide dissociation stimulator-like isoform X2 n=1 Tax=Nycticebus coucang TaxID=9470 RepID=UPI00234C8F03|nr:ral guanine nucleotide dissociation stimulator-like isoform X2 [Nycticebus coucang]
MSRGKLLKRGISKLASMERNPQRAQMRQRRRKAFKILQQLQLLQVTANNFGFQPDKEFQSWFQSMKPLEWYSSHSFSWEPEPPFE